METESISQRPKYERPKVLAIDLGREALQTLEKEGYNVSDGTFGTPYRVQKGSQYQPVIMKPSLPNYTEQEIIIVDLAPKKPTEHAEGEKSTPDDELDWWAKCSSGIIDPRPRGMAMVQDDLDRILKTGGLFVIFADIRNSQELVYARSRPHYGFEVSVKIPFDNWSFLSILSNLTITADHGKEMKTIRTDRPLALLLADYLEDASFRCTFEPQWDIEGQWEVLAKNKYGEAVAGTIAPAEKSKAGWILIFPQLRKKGEFLAALMKNILPNFAPALFPHVEGQKWVHRAEYELPSVVEKALKISVIQDEAAKKVEVLEKAIQADREANRFLYDLLRETGGSLVKAVKKALGILGLTSVIDVDDEMKRAGKDAALREDLRIHDISPVLVVDVKGVAGHPADAEALQAQKHAFIYIQETGRADVRGLTIINHQRLLPPLDRDNEMPFRKEILDNAAQVRLGLITAWDLFRLTRGFLRNSWAPDHVKPLLYLTGRIRPIPTHYEFVGTVKQVWKSAFSIMVESAEVHVGDRIAIEFPVDFEEQAISSLRLNDVDAEAASCGVEVGISRMESLPKVKAGFPVYRIKANELAFLSSTTPSEKDGKIQSWRC